MKTVYILKHIHRMTEIVAVFSDVKKAEQAFSLFSDYIESRYPALNVEQAQGHEIQEKWYRNMKNGHVIKLEESKLFTDLEQFKKMIIN